jgi:hypothetical protein
MNATERVLDKPEVNKRVKRRIANRVHAMRKQDKEKAKA